jgi:hypothetical protein
VFGFAGAVMTLSKTALYLAVEFFCGGCSVGHNSFRDLLVYWIIPNGYAWFIHDSSNVLTLFNRLWLIVPSLIVLQLGKDISASLQVVEYMSKQLANSKKD